MSLQSKAKELQGYVTVQRGCLSCAHFMSDLVLPKWMQEHNSTIDAGLIRAGVRYSVSAHGVEKNLRCSIGGFAVKKTASCDRYEVKIT